MLLEFSWHAKNKRMKIIFLSDIGQLREVKDECRNIMTNIKQVKSRLSMIRILIVLCGKRNYGVLPH